MAKSNTIVVGEILNTPTMTKKEFKEFLKTYAKESPEKYAKKVARGEFDRFAAKLSD